MYKRKKFLAILLTVICLMTMNMSVLAADSTESDVTITESASVGARSIYGYAADYTDSEFDNFIVSAPGSYSLTGHATLKTSDFGSSTQIVYVSIYRPDGTLARGNVKLTGNQEVVVSFTNAQPGNYTVGYSVSGVYKGWVHCWIY